MVLIHTPRVLYNIGKGLLKRYNNNNNKSVIASTVNNTNEQQDNNNDNIILGVGYKTPHTYYSRVGLFDIDYLGHMNNAAYLSHCEYARWEMCSTNGLLQAMIRTGSNFVVGSSCIRFRKEIRPLYKQFYIQSYLCGINNRSLYMIQNFRTTTNKSNNKNNKSSTNTDRIVAQVIIEGLTIRNRTVIDPELFLLNDCNIPLKHINALQISNNNNDTNNPDDIDDDDNDIDIDTETKMMNPFQQIQLKHYITLDQSLKNFASADDNRK